MQPGIHVIHVDHRVARACSRSSADDRSAARLRQAAPVIYKKSRSRSMRRETKSNTIVRNYYLEKQYNKFMLRLTCSSILRRVVPLLGEQLLRRPTPHAFPEYLLVHRFRNRHGGTGPIVARRSSTIIPLLVPGQRVLLHLHPRALFVLLVDRVTGQGETMEEQIGIDPPPIGRVERGVTAALHSPLVRWKCLFN